MFVEPFLEAVKALDKAKTDRERLEEFKRFVDEFGTHYSSTTEMGTRLAIERRYTREVYDALQRTCVVHYHILFLAYEEYLMTNFSSTH